jgi:hypothetical protein
MIFVIVVLATTSRLAAQSYAKVNINNVATFVWNDGRMDISPDGNAGFEYWKGTKIYSVYTSGLYWGGYINNELRVGGTRYTSSLRTGFVNDDGSPNITGAFSQVYKVRPDYKTATLYGEMNDENKTEEAIRKQYALDFENWPVHLGAPYYDTNKNGRYDKGKDIPGFLNADQTLWFISNDMVVDKDEVYPLPFISRQTNIELQTTVWACSQNDFLKGVVFKKYKLINKSKTDTIKQMHAGMFCDSDLAYPGNDLNGCDTTLHLGYSYNGNDFDYNYVNKQPVMGFLLLKGACVPGTTEDQIFVDGKRIRSKKDLLMTSFSSYWPEYTWGIEPFVPTLNFYYYHLQGMTSKGHLVPNPFTKITSTKQSSGDPVKGTGWIDNYFQVPGDRIFVISSGPFNMAPGDTQEIIFAQIVTSSTSRLGSISYLKYLAKYVKDFYGNGMVPKTTDVEKETELPTHFSLEQNYPNPFNPSTTIEYAIPRAEHVTVKVYDVLGREIATLVDEFKQAGTYNSQFSIGNYQLGSGVYFYILQAGEYISTKKMVLLK